MRLLRFFLNPNLNFTTVLCWSYLNTTKLLICRYHHELVYLHNFHKGEETLAKCDENMVCKDHILTAWNIFLQTVPLSIMTHAVNGAILVLCLPLYWVISFQTFPANPFDHFLAELQVRQS
jgi:hypothetical protein